MLANCAVNHWFDRDSGNKIVVAPAHVVVCSECAPSWRSAVRTEGPSPKAEASEWFQPSRLNLTRASETERTLHTPPNSNKMSQGGYGNPYARPGPKPADPQFGKCAGCGGGRFLWQPKQGRYAGQSLISCCLPFEQRQGACREYQPVNMNTGHSAPAPVNDGSYPGGWSSVPAGYSQVPQPLGTPLVPEPPQGQPSPNLEQALHAWCEQMHEMGAMLAENIRLLTALQPKQAQ